MGTYSAFKNSCIIFIGHFFSPLRLPSIGNVTVIYWCGQCIPLTTPFNLNQLFIIISLVLCIRKAKKKKFIKIIGWIKGNNIIQGPKRFSYEKNACAKVHKHIDIYFRWSGDFWFVSKFLVVVCSRSCHGSGSGISKALLHLIQKVLFVLFIKLLEVCVKESVTNQIPRGRLNINQLLSILFQSHSCICCSHCIHGWEIA